MMSLSKLFNIQKEKSPFNFGFTSVFDLWGKNNYHQFKPNIIETDTDIITDCWLEVGNYLNSSFLKFEKDEKLN